MQNKGIAHPNKQPVTAANPTTATKSIAKTKKKKARMPSKFSFYDPKTRLAFILTSPGAELEALLE